MEHRERRLNGLYGKELLKKNAYSPTVWVALYRRSFLEKNGMTFYEGILHEDEEFTARALYFAEGIKYIDTRFYYYRIQSGGIMNTFNSKKITDLVLVMKSLKTFQKFHNNNIFSTIILKRILSLFNKSIILGMNNDKLDYMTVKIR